jgi:predicted nucleotide-binding protein
MAARITKQEAIDLLTQAKDATAGLQHGGVNSPNFVKWKRDTEVAIMRIFGQNARHRDEFTAIRYSPPNNTLYRSGDAAMHIKHRAYTEGLGIAGAILASMVDEVQNLRDEDLAPMPSATAEWNESGQGTPATRKVFVVHGHDHGFKEAVARVLTTLEMEPVILHEQPDQGKTIIEKFSDYSDVSFAVALLTPDDLGEAKAKVKTVDDLGPRARQNVIFEFGYFIGKLGRSNACGLVKGHVDTPSDYSGVLYIAYDEPGQWKFQLARELRAAGFVIDANRLL